MKKYLLLFLLTALTVSSQNEVTYKYLYVGANKKFVQKNRTDVVLKPVLLENGYFREFSISYNGETTEYQIKEEEERSNLHVRFLAASSINVYGGLKLWNEIWTPFMLTKDILFYYIQGLDGNVYTHVATNIPLSRWRTHLLLERQL